MLSQMEGSQPYNVEIEQALLGHLLVHPHRIEVAATLIDPEHFYDPLHGRIYGEVVRLGANGTVSPLTVGAVLRDDAGLKELGGHAYLAAMAEMSPAAADLAGWAKHLRLLAVRRAMESVGKELIALAHSDLTPEEIDAEAESLSERLHSARHGAALTDTLRPFHEQLEAATGLSEAAQKDPRGT